MKIDEFKAWFEGFTESMGNPPNAKQWERIKARVAEIDGQPLTQTVFLERYVRRYPYPNHYREYFGPYNGLSTTCGINEVYSSTAAMNTLGKQEYLSS